MGLIIIDHSQGQGLDGKDGFLQEFDCRTCAHRQSLIALLRRPRETLVLSNMDLGRASLSAQHFQNEYVHKYRCRYCRKNICRACAQGGKCTPWIARIENAVKKKRWEEHWEYEYSQCLGS